MGRGAYLKEFADTDGLISIPGDAWLQYASPAKGDVYTFRTIPEGHSAAAPVLEYTAWYHFYAGSGRVKLALTLENNDHGGRTPAGTSDK